MTQPVQYRLRAPLFISSRLAPALNVADATIYMEAVTVDRDDEHDPRVVWQYSIEGPTVSHAGRDLTTPYLGPHTVAGQLPTAMGTLLDSLGHVADGDAPGRNDTSLPDALYQWVRHNRDEITAMADLVAAGPETPMPAAAVWWAITHDPDQTPYGRWCAGQATAHADRMATLDPTSRTAFALPVRDDQWHVTALGWYTMLTNNPGPEPAPASACVVADRDAILAWLRGPAPYPSTTSMAQYLRLDHAAADEWRIPDLIEQAQLAGLFGVAGHTIRAHPVVNEPADPVTHLLTITTPGGARVATEPFPAIRPSRQDNGPYAAPEILQRCAAHVDDALATQPMLASTPTSRARPFPRVDATPAAKPIPDAAPRTQTGRPRHR